MPYEWKPKQGEIARRIYPKDIAGFFKKEIIVHEFERVFFIQDGVITQILSHGKHNVGGLLVKDRTAIYVDFSDKDLLYGFSDLRAGDGVVIKCHGEIRFRTKEPQLFYVNLLTSSDALTLNDLWARLKLELNNVISPVFANYRTEDLYGKPEVRKGFYDAIDMEMRKTFQRWGLELIQFTVNYVYPERWVEMEKKRLDILMEAKLKYGLKCPKCGTMVPGGAKFCSVCGSTVEV